MSETVITTQGLAKHYGQVQAVDGIDLNVRRGEIYGFLGRNGAGKTTTIRMLLGLIHPSAGEISLFGSRVSRGSQPVLSRVGCLVETATAYPNLTVRENLEIQRRLTRAPAHAVGEAMALWSLEAYADRRAGQLSLGNKQRLALARAVLHKPELLVLDEPANALDPAGIVETRGFLRRLADEQGVTIFMSSHILGEVAHLADRIGIVHAGRMVEELDIETLRHRARKSLEVTVSNSKKAAALLGEKLGLAGIESTGDTALRLFEGLDRSAEIAKVLVEGGHALSRLCVQEEDLESYFMRLTGGEA